MNYSSAFALSLALSAAAAGRVRAAAFTWDGGGAAGGTLTWATATNWNPNTVPDNNGTADITFAGTIDPTPNLNAAWSINSLTFASGAAAFTLGSGTGAALTIGAGGIVDLDDSVQTISHAIVMAVPQGWRNNAGGSLVVTGPVNTNGHLLSVAAGGTVTLGGALSGVRGGLVKTGAGTLLLNGGTANTADGTVTLAGGTLQLAKTGGATAIAGDLVIGDGSGTGIDQLVSAGDEQIANGVAVGIFSTGAWNLAGRTETVAGLDIVSTGVFGGGEVSIGTGQLTLGSLEMTGGSVASTGAGKLVLQGPVQTHAAALPATITGTVQLGGLTRDFIVADGAAAPDLDLPAAVTTGTLRKLGAGTLRLSGTGSTAGITVADGTVSFTSAASAGSGIITLSGGLLTSDGGPHTLTNPIAIASDSKLAAINLSGPITLAGDCRLDGGPGTVEISGPVGGDATTNALTLSFPNAVLNFTGATANTFTGRTTILSGIVRAMRNAGTTTFAGDLVVGQSAATGSGANLNINGANQIANSASVTVERYGSFYANGDTIAALTINGGFSSGHLQLSGNGLTMFGGGVGGAHGVSSALRLTGPASFHAEGATTSVVDAPVDLGGTTRSFYVADGAAAVDAEFMRPISEGGVYKTGAGLMRVSGDNPLSTSFVIEEGTIQFAGGTNGAGSGTLQLLGGAIESGGLARLSNFLSVQQHAAITGADSSILLLDGPIVIQFNAELAVSSSGRVVLDGGAGGPHAIAGLGRIAKSGNGLLVIDRPAGNTYSGGTQITGGGVFLRNTSGSATGSGPVVVSGDAGLLAIGAVSGAVTMTDGAYLEPGGTGAGSFATGPLSLGPGNRLHVDLAAPGVVGGNVNDLLVVNGALTLDGTLFVTELSGFANGVYRLFDYTGPLTNNGLVLAPGFLAAHPGSTISVSTPGQVNLIVGPPNQPPVAGNDAISTPQGTGIAIPAAQLLSNDSDPDNDPLTVQSVSAASAQGGTVVLQGGTVTYTPPAGFAGNDSFTYTLSDGRGGTASGSVLVTVTATSAAPPDFLGLTYEAGGTRLRWRDFTTRVFRVEYSSTLAAGSWQSLPGTVTANGAGLIEFLDPTLPLPHRRFYRLITPP